MKICQTLFLCYIQVWAGVILVLLPCHLSALDNQQDQEVQVGLDPL